MTTWTPDSWRAKPISQVPAYPDPLALAEAERQLILATFAHCGRNKERTAAALGISLKTLYNRLKEYAAEGSDDKS